MTTHAEQLHLAEQGLYDPANEHDACGVGFVAHIKGVKSHDIVTGALKILENLDHRGAVGADALMGDGAGILIQLPDALYREEMAKQGVALPPPGEYVADGAARQAAWVLSGEFPSWPLDAPSVTHESEPTPHVRARYTEAREHWMSS